MQKLKNVSARGLRGRWRTIALLVGAATGLTLAPMALAAAPPAGTTVDSPTLGSASRLTMDSATTGWAFGGKAFLRTTDSGRDWTNVTPKGLTIRKDQPSGAPNVVWDFLSATSAWIVEQPQQSSGIVHLWFTDDGGRQWTEHTHTFSDLAHSPEATLTSIDFLNADQGWIQWGLDLWETDNGGQSWTREIIAKTAMPTASAVTFRNATTGWAIIDEPGNGGTGFALEDSTNGGKTWQSASLIQQAGLEPLEMLPTFTGSQGLLAAYRSRSNGLVVLRTSDYGQRWTVVSAAVPNSLSSSDTWGVQTIGGTTAWALAEGRLWQSTNGVHSWTYRSADRFLTHASGFDFVNAQTGWVWKANATGITRIWMTTSGGTRWTTWTPTVNPSAVPQR
jgi:hypothetical protein